MVDELQKASEEDYQTALLAFINCLVISAPALKDRVRVRNEFIGEFDASPRSPRAVYQMPLINTKTKIFIFSPLFQVWNFCLSSMNFGEPKSIQNLSPKKIVCQTEKMANRKKLELFESLLRFKKKPWNFVCAKWSKNNIRDTRGKISVGFSDRQVAKLCAKNDVHRTDECHAAPAKDK